MSSAASPGVEPQAPPATAAQPLLQGTSTKETGDAVAPAAPSTPVARSGQGSADSPADGGDHRGLSTEEAERRLREDGPNELPTNEVNPCVKFLGYFWGPMPIMIWIAIIVELVEATQEPQHWLDFGVLLLLQIVNGLVGWYEERNAGNAIAALRKELALRANVKRDGNWVELPARLLVRGDVVHLGLGCVVPADCDLLPDVSGLPIQVDQSALNGESLPKTVCAGGRVFQGTIVKRGEIDAEVVDTGVRTFFGRASALVASAERAKSSGGHFQKLVTQLTLALLLLSLSLVSALSVKMLICNEKPLKVVSMGVVLLVASIPIAMQVVCTSTMAVGAHKLAKSKALVCKLTAIEELAAMDVLCSDKTGTLTMNELSVRPPAWVLDGSNVTEDELLFFAALAARRGGSEQDAIDKCICTDVTRRGYQKALEAHQTLHFVPFDPVTKRTEAIVEARSELPRGSKGQAAPVPSEWRGKQVMVMKGAPQVVLALAKDADRIHDTVTQVVNAFAAKGFRALGVARACHYQGTSASDSAPAPVWEFLGLVPLFDPPRADTMATIGKARQLGIEVKMITGDQLAIAKETARTLGMGTQIHRADALTVPEGAGTGSPQELQVAECVENSNGFAEVFPEHKFKIVQMLQNMNHRVGMTGDGVNDAPALKAGDVGIAVKGSTDAARAAADIVLTSDGLSVIIEAIARARMIFERMRNYCIYRIACTTNLLFFFFFAGMFINPNSLTAGKAGSASFELPVLCLVLITLLNDGCILTIAYDKVQPSATPSIWNLRECVLLAATMGFMSCFAGILLLLGGLYALDDESAFYQHFWNGFLRLDLMNLNQVKTMLYLTVSVLGFLTIFAARTRGPFFSRRPAFPLLCAGLFALAASTVFAATNFVKAVSSGTDTADSALPASVIGLVWAYCIIWFLAEDTAKTLLLRFIQRHAEQQHQGAAFGSSFWRVSGTVASRVSAAQSSLLSVAEGGPQGGRSLLATAHQVASTAADSHRAENARQLATDLEQQTSTVQAPSLLSKSSFISASLTADPRAGNKGGEVVSKVGAGSGASGRPSLQSTTALSTPTSLNKLSVAASSARPSDASLSATAAIAAIRKEAALAEQQSAPEARGQSGTSATTPERT